VERAAGASLSASLAPLEAAVADRFQTWLEKLAYPIREGEHAQTRSRSVLRSIGRAQIERPWPRCSSGASANFT
jgi:hypothetical protein